MTLVFCRYVAPALQRFTQQGGLQQELLGEPPTTIAAQEAAGPDGEEQAVAVAHSVVVAALGEELAAVTASCHGSRGAGQEVPAGMVVALLKQHLRVH
jgi:hypothetical protein